MANRPGRATAAELNRACRAALAHGMCVELLPDGTIRLRLPLDTPPPDTDDAEEACARAFGVAR